MNVYNGVKDTPAKLICIDGAEMYNKLRIKVISFLKRDWSSLPPELKARKKPVLIKTGFLESGREEGIRTLDTLFTYTRFPGVRLKPLIHLSVESNIFCRLIL